MTVAWTTVDAVQAQLGPTVPFATDPVAQAVVDAANAAAYRKRAAAGYVDDPADDAPAPSPDVAHGTTLWAVGLWRERAATDGFASFDALGSYPITTGSWGQIARLLGVGRGQVDAVLVDDDTLARLRAARRHPAGRLTRLVGWP